MPKSMEWNGGDKPKAASEPMATQVGIGAGGALPGPAFSSETKARPPVQQAGRGSLEWEGDGGSEGLGVDVARMEQAGADENTTRVGRMRMRRN